MTFPGSHSKQRFKDLGLRQLDKGGIPCGLLYARAGLCIVSHRRGCSAAGAVPIYQARKQPQRAKISEDHDRASGFIQTCLCFPLWPPSLLELLCISPFPNISLEPTRSSPWSDNSEQSKVRSLQ